jgi:hypothetical protein
MKRKANAALVAAIFGALLSQGAAGQCPVPGNGATPFVAGPVDPVNGFAEYVRDSNDLALELCLAGDGATGPCFFDPVVAGNLYSQQIGFGAEGFWWLAEAAIAAPNGINAVVVMAAEAAWAAEIPQPGQNFPFTRLRIRLDVPQPGTYGVEHPFGRHEFVVDAVGAGDEVREVFDIPFLPGQTNQGCVGPWLVSQGFPAIIAGFPGTHIGNGTPLPTTGGHRLRVTGPVSAETDLFTIFGKIWDGRLNTPLAALRASYDRPALGGQVAQVDAFATSAAPAAAVSVAGGPGLPAGALALAGPDGAGRFFRSEVLPNPAPIPPFVSLTATASDTDPTVLLLPLTDVVTITRAQYDLASGRLLVEGISSDAGNPALTLVEYAEPLPASIATAVPPATVTVRSANGGLDTEPVAVVNLVPTPQPPVITSTPVTSATLGLPYAYDVAATDPDSTVLTYALTQAPAGMSIDATTGLIAWVPGATGDFPVTVQVSDDGTPPLSATQSFTVTVAAAPNRPPVANDQTVTTPEDTAVAITLTATDDDGDPLTYALAGAPVRGTLSGTPPNLRYTPNANANGADSFTFRASDGRAASNLATVSIDVTPVNDAPVITSTPPANNAAVGQPFAFTVTATDIDGDRLAFSLTQAPAGMSIDPASGLISWTPAATGTFPVTVRATDSGTPPLFAQQSFTLTVIAVDLDIQGLSATGTVRHPGVVAVTLRVRNGGTVDQPRNVTLTGEQNGRIFITLTQQVDDPVGGGSTSFNWAIRTEAVGTITWRAVIADDDPDIDVATATTRVR